MNRATIGYDVWRRRADFVGLVAVKASLSGLYCRFYVFQPVLDQGKPVQYLFQQPHYVIVPGTQVLARGV